MKMGRKVIAKEHLDDDAKEAADFRHERVHATWVERLRAFYP
jgi:hypothetical protein